MKVTCPQCGREFEIPEAQSNKLLKCICKALFRPGTKGLKESKPAHPSSAPPSPPTPNTNDAPPDIQLQVKKSSYYTDEEVPEPSESSLSNSQINSFLSTLKEGRDQVFTPDSRAESKPRKITPITDIELGEANVEKKPESAKPQPDPNLTERLEKAVEADPIDQAIAATEVQSKVKRSSQPQTKVSTIHRKKTLLEKWQTLGVAMKAGIITGVALPIIVTIIVLNQEEVVVQEMDPTLVKLLSPQAPPPKKIEKLETPKREETKVVAKPKELETPAAPPASALRMEEIRREFFAGRFENLIRIAANASGPLSSEELALLFEAKLIRAERNQERIKEIELEINQALKNRDNHSALLRSQSAAQVRSSIDAKDLSRAFQTLKSLSLTRARDPIVFAYLGMAYEKMDRLDLAHQSWDQALMIESHFVWLIERREQIYRVLKNFVQAEKMALKLTNIPGAEASGYQLLAKQAEAQGKTEAAASAYRSALKYKEDPETRLSVAKITKGTASIADLERAAKAAKTPKAKASAFFELGEHYCKSKNYSLGISYLRKALQERPELADAHIERARCERNSGQAKRSIESFERALKYREKDSELWYEYGAVLITDGKLRAAISALQRSISIEASDRAHLKLALILLDQKKRAEALVHAKRASKLNPQNSEAKKLVAQLEK